MDRFMQGSTARGRALWVNKDAEEEQQWHDTAGRLDYLLAHLVSCFSCAWLILVASVAQWDSCNFSCLNYLSSSLLSSHAVLFTFACSIIRIIPGILWLASHLVDLNCVCVSGCQVVLVWGGLVLWRVRCSRSVRPVVLLRRIVVDS